MAGNIVEAPPNYLGRPIELIEADLDAAAKGQSLSPQPPIHLPQMEQAQTLIKAAGAPVTDTGEYLNHPAHNPLLNSTR